MINRPHGNTHSANGSRDHHGAVTVRSRLGHGSVTGLADGAAAAAGVAVDADEAAGDAGAEEERARRVRHPEELPDHPCRRRRAVTTKHERNVTGT